MSLRKFFQPQTSTSSEALAFLFLRIVVGVAFMFHGWGKIQSPFGWMGPESSVPGILQFLAAFSEFGGGLAWVLGLLTRLAALGIGITMAVAVHLHMVVMKDPFVNTTGGSSYELALVFFAIAILFFTNGAGKYSLDAKVFGVRSSS